MSSRLFEFRVFGFEAYLYDCTNKMDLSTKNRLLRRVVTKRVFEARPKSIIVKCQSCKLLPMPIRTCHIATVLAIALAGSTLGGCASINEKLSAGMGDSIPQWAGGLPPDAPPRPGTAKYEEYMKERERKRLIPAAERGEESKPDASSLPAVH